jgi:acyl carrier protein
VLQATPATWRMLVDAGWQGVPPEPALRALCGGEALPERLAAELRARSGAVWNLYGPTETTIWSAVSRVGEGGVTVGRPIANTRIVLLDGRLRPVPAGVAGELWIGGGGLARGYRHRPDLTAERFVPDPFAAEPGARMYRTGDRARHRPDSTVELLGRVDQQVKVRGFRIEPGEVEAALEAHPAVAHAVVAAHGGDGDRRLVAWLVPRAGDGFDGSPLSPLWIAELRESLGRSLPDYLVPTAWVVVDALPLTPNGKVDRSRLPAPDGSRPAAAYVAPRSALEEVVAGIWAEVLGVEQVGVEDNFFTLGGHSLLAARVLSRLGEALEIEVPLRRLFEAPTVAGLARALLGAAPSAEELEQSARLVLDLLRFSDAEVEDLLQQHAANGAAVQGAW